jgi:NADH:ubiquinone oxidoreductase subunit 6 (subunit J)
VVFEQVVFWVLAVGGVTSALVVVHLRDIFKGALFLVVTFLAVAGIFALLSAEFLAVVQVLIYAGAISILILFAVMLTRDVQTANTPSRMQPLALTLGALFLAALIFTIANTGWSVWEQAGLAPNTLVQIDNVLSNSPQWLADLLLRDYVLPFEVASVVLLAAIIGALALVREG